MIDPKLQWAIQIDITNACTRKCSNCTRLIGHVRHPFSMEVDQFCEAAEALKDFPTKSPKSPFVDVLHKVVGVIGGEPLLHPYFAEIAEALEQAIPARENRGLWTGLNWKKTQYAKLIGRVFGYVNNNTHSTDCRHSPVLVAVDEVVKDPTTRQLLINECWLQRLWSGTITPKGFFFCEVAGAMDIVFDGPGGLLIEPDCWNRPLADFQSQIDTWCHLCGIPLNLPGRPDAESVDDVTPANLQRLLDSGCAVVGNHRVFDPADYQTNSEDTKPWQYLQ